MVHSSVLEKPSDFIYFSGFALVMLSKISLPHIHGQKIIEKSEEVAEELYDVAWCGKSRAQSKDWLIMMTQNQNSFDFSIQGFYALDVKSLGAVNVLNF
jgi:hypothetical protein